eukprot:355173-Chlamydomonas_euryale.AAC.2
MAIVCEPCHTKSTAQHARGWRALAVQRVGWPGLANELVRQHAQQAVGRRYRRADATAAAPRAPAITHLTVGPAQGGRRGRIAPSTRGGKERESELTKSDPSSPLPACCSSRV